MQRAIRRSWLYLRFSRSGAIILLAASVLSAGVALADEPQPMRQSDSQAGGTGSSHGDAVQVEAIDVSAERAGDAGDGTAQAARSMDDPAFVTVVHIDERAGETTSVAEILAKSMGVYVRSLGGLGSFSSISVRGAESGHTQVLIDGVPLSQIASVSADLGRFSQSSFTRLELYRGAVPVELGGAALGGALNLITDVGTPSSGAPWQLSMGTGSFGARHLGARWRDSRGPHHYHLGIGYAGASGDFEYFSDKGTNLDLDDDELVPRTNNGYDQVDGVGRYRFERGDLVAQAGSRTLWKAQGLPGSGSAQASQASLVTAGQLFDASVARQRFLGSPRLGATASAFASLEWQHYRDLAGEVGVGTQDRRYLALSSGGTARLSVDAGDAQLLSAGLEARIDSFTERDALAVADGSVTGRGLRTSAALMMSDEISLGRADALVISPGVRLDWQHTVPPAGSRVPVPTDGSLDPRDDIYFTPRLAARLRMSDGVAIKGSAGRYVRAPTAIELFGDRGYVVGNSTLQAESGIAADMGLVLALPQTGRALGLRGWPGLPGLSGLPGLIDRVYIESAVFMRASRDTIAFVTGAGLATIAVNIGDAHVYGSETGLSVRLGRLLTVSGNYTFLYTRQDSTRPSYDGKPLPQRPRHQLYGRFDLDHRLAGRPITLWTDITLVTGNYLDAAALSPVPERCFLGAGVTLEPRPGLVIGLEGKNLADQRIETVTLSPAPRPDLMQVPRAVSDFSGYPLPGRAFYVTVEWNL